MGYSRNRERAADAAQSWAVLLARTLRWNAVVHGVPGVGYVRSGAGEQDPSPACSP